MNTAELINISSFLTKYFASEPVIMTAEEGNGDDVTVLYWTYMLHEVTGHPALGVAIDFEQNALVAEEAEGYSFNQDVRYMLRGVAIDHNLDFILSAVHVDGSGPIDESTDTQHNSTTLLH